MECMLRGVTPRQLLEYWDSRMKDFTDGRLALPTLTFLKSPENIDRVITSGFTSKGISVSASGNSEGKLRVSERNSYAETSGLDPRLRPTLERGGFATQAYNDRYLISIQHSAQSWAKGRHMILPEGKMRKMVIWAARILSTPRESLFK